MNSEATQTVTPARPSWLRRQFRRLFLLGLGLAVLVWFAPAMVANTDLRHQAAAWIFGDLQGTIHVGQASLGWFAPVVLHDVEVRDPDGELLLTAPRVESAYTLLQLASHPEDLGPFHFEQPVLHVVLTDRSSNLEKALHRYLFPDPAAAASRLAVEVQVADGRVELHAGDSQWTLEKVQTTVHYPGDDSTPLQVKMTAQAAGGGRLSSELVYHGWNNSDQSLQPSAEAALTTEQWPLAMLNPLLRRLAVPLHAQGQLQTQLKAAWKAGWREPAKAKLEGQVAVAQLEVAGDGLQGDTLKLERLVLPCQVELQGSAITVQRARLECEAGQVSIHGHLDSAQEIWTLLEQSGCGLSADVDLARLAQLLPRTLRLKADTRIEEGRLHLVLNSGQQRERTVWHGVLQTSRLRGQSQGQKFSWDEPISATFDAYQGKNQWPLIEQLQCQSSFLQIQAAQTGKQWNATARYDLDRLAHQLAQFLDLGSLQLAGTGATRLALEQQSNGSFRLQGASNFEKLTVKGLASSPLLEEHLTCQIVAAGKLSATGSPQIETAALQLEADGDRAALQLLQPLTLEAAAAGKLKLSVQGDVAHWQRRLQPFIAGLDRVQLAGQGELTTLLTGSAAQVELTDTHLLWNKAQCRGAGLWLNEPVIEMRSAGRWDRATGKLSLQNTQLTAKAVQVAAPHFEIVPAAAAGYSVQGSAQVAGDLARLQSWVSDPRTPAPVAGQFTGQVALNTTASAVGMQLDVTATDVVAGNSAQPAWREPKIHLQGRLVYDVHKDLLQLENLAAETAALRCVSQGQLKGVAGSQELNLEGQLSYDLAKLEPVLQTYLGSSFKIAGRDTKPFHLEGALASVTPVQPGQAAAVGGAIGSLRGQAGLSWQQIKGYGFEAGPAIVQTQLIKGWIQTQPITATLSQGRLTMQPLLRLSPGPVELYLTRGKTIDHARITPDMCANALKYALPALANMTEGEGEISLNLTGGRIPLGDVNKADIAGEFIVHNARISATPLLRELSAVLQHPAEARLAQESHVPFRVYNGRVYHEKMELVFPGMTVKTHGWVGLNGQLELVAEMPVPRRWLKNDNLGQALAKQTITLPVRGTLERPQIDGEALRAASARFLRDTATNVLEQELNKGLKKLLTPRR